MVNFAKLAESKNRFSNLENRLDVALTARHALRTLPMLAPAANPNARNYSAKLSTTILPGFRCILVASFAAKYPNEAIEVNYAVLILAKAAIVSAYDAAAGRAAKAAHDAFVAVLVSYPANSVTDSVLNSLLAHDIEGALAAGYATDDFAPYDNADHAALSAHATDRDLALDDVGSIGAQAAFYASAAERAEIGPSISQGKSVKVEALLRKPLWTNGMPEDMSIYWRDLKSHLLKLNQGWDVWIELYEAELNGAEFNKPLDLAIALKPKEFWQQDIPTINAEIRLLVEEHKLRFG